MKIVALRRVILPIAVLAAPSALTAQTMGQDMSGPAPEVPGAPMPGEAQPIPQPGVPSPPNDPTRPSPVPENPTMPTPPETPMPPSTPSQPGMPSDPTMSGDMSHGQMGEGSAGQAGMMAPGGVRWAPKAVGPAPTPQASYPPCSASVQDQCQQMPDRKSRRARPHRR
ncbi:MAG: hypothetical protein ACKOXK_08760 [Chakrabartia sp.]